MYDILDIPSYVVTLDIEKAFGSSDHNSLLSVLIMFGFGENFKYQMKILLNDQQSCVMNQEFFTLYFNLEKDTRQDELSGIPVNICFRSSLSVNQKNTDRRNNCLIIIFLYTTFLTNSTFSLNDSLSVKNLIDSFGVISLS